MLPVDLQFFELLLHPSPFFIFGACAHRNARKLLSIALKKTRRDQEEGTSHRVDFGFAVIDDQFVTLDAFLDPIQEYLTRVVRQGVETSKAVADGALRISGSSCSNISSSLPR